jgi:hypothetical protein
MGTRKATKGGGGLVVKSGIKGGKLAVNHNRAGLRVKSGVRAGAGKLATNHSRVSL